MVNFAELKAKAEKAKDVSVAKVTNTRDRMSSVPSSKVVWDPNWKRGSAGSTPASATPRASTSGPPPPPVRASPGVTASGGGATLSGVPRVSRPPDVDDVPVPAPYTLRPPPTRVTSGYPPSHRETASDAVDRIDWANLSAEDKAAFFGWLDEFFSRFLGIQVGPTRQGSAAPSPPPTFAVDRAQHMIIKPPPTVNMATRPQM